MKDFRCASLKQSNGMMHKASILWLSCANVRSLLSGDTESSAGSAGRLGLLTSDLESPEVSETSVGSDLLQSFQIFSELGVDTVGDELGPVSITDVSLSVQEPLGNVVVCKCEKKLDKGNKNTGKYKHHKLSGIVKESYQWAWRGCR